jgi:hypothetical protein
MAEEQEMRVLPVAADIPVGADEVRVVDEGGPRLAYTPQTHQELGR